MGDGGGAEREMQDVWRVGEWRSGVGGCAAPLQHQKGPQRQCAPPHSTLPCWWRRRGLSTATAPRPAPPAPHWAAQRHHSRQPPAAAECEGGQADNAPAVGARHHVAQHVAPVTCHAAGGRRPLHGRPSALCRSLLLRLPGCCGRRPCPGPCAGRHLGLEAHRPGPGHAVSAAAACSAVLLLLPAGTDTARRWRCVAGLQHAVPARRQGRYGRGTVRAWHGGSLAAAQYVLHGALSASCMLLVCP